MLNDRTLQTTLECGPTLRYRPMDDTMRFLFAEALPAIKDAEERKRACHEAICNTIERCVLWWDIAERSPGGTWQPLPITRAICRDGFGNLVLELMQAIAREDGAPVYAESECA